MTKASTETALQSAMTALLRTRPLQKLTVGEIARAAGVSRVTFYHYYRDLYDLAGAVLAGEMERAMGADQTPENWEEGLLRLMRTMRENRWLTGKISASDGWGQIERMLHETVFRQVMAVAEGFPDTGAPEDDRVFAAHFYEHALTGLIFSWAGSGMKEEPETVVRRLAVMLTGQLETALRQFGAAAKEEKPC